MGKKVEVEWSIRAEADLDNIYNYLLIHWTEKEADYFLELALEFQNLIAQYPGAFPKSRKRKSYRIGLIHRNVTALYIVNPGKITILSLVDNRSKSKSRW
jgi:plasmid stabilization system protein ParE